MNKANKEIARELGELCDRDLLEVIDRPLYLQAKFSGHSDEALKIAKEIIKSRGGEEKVRQSVVEHIESERQKGERLGWIFLLSIFFVISILIGIVGPDEFLKWVRNNRAKTDNPTEVVKEIKLVFRSNDRPYDNVVIDAEDEDKIVQESVIWSDHDCVKLLDPSVESYVENIEWIVPNLMPFDDCGRPGHGRKKTVSAAALSFLVKSRSALIGVGSPDR